MCAHIARGLTYVCASHTDIQKNRLSKIDNQESKIENRLSKIDNRESKIENQLSKIDNRESKIEKSNISPF